MSFIRSKSAVRGGPGGEGLERAVVHRIEGGEAELDEVEALLGRGSGADEQPPSPGEQDVPRALIVSSRSE